MEFESQHIKSLKHIESLLIHTDFESNLQEDGLYVKTPDLNRYFYKFKINETFFISKNMSRDNFKFKIKLVPNILMGCLGFFGFISGLAIGSTEGYFWLGICIFIIGWIIGSKCYGRDSDDNQKIENIGNKILVLAIKATPHTVESLQKSLNPVVEEPKVNPMDRFSDFDPDAAGLLPADEET